MSVSFGPIHYFFCCYLCICMSHLMSSMLLYPCPISDRGESSDWEEQHAEKWNKLPCHLLPVAASKFSTGVSALWFPKLLFQRYSSGKTFIPFLATGEKLLTLRVFSEEINWNQAADESSTPRLPPLQLGHIIVPVWHAVTPVHWAQSKELSISSAEDHR